LSKPTINGNIITQDDSSFGKQSPSPDAPQSSIQSEELNINNDSNNSDNETNLHTIATTTNLTHSFNQARSDSDMYYRHPFFNAYMNYTHSVPSITQYPFAMTTAPHSHMQLNNTVAAPIGNIEIDSKCPAFENINNSQLTESPMTNSSFHSNVNEDTDLYKFKIPNTPTFETKEEKRHRKELQRILRNKEETEWIKNVTQDSIILSEDKNLIESIGNKQISTINCNLLTRIARKFHGVIPHNKRKKEDVLNIILNTVLSKEYSTCEQFVSKSKLKYELSKKQVATRLPFGSTSSGTVHFFVESYCVYACKAYTSIFLAVTVTPKQTVDYFCPRIFVRHKPQ
jgi:hypothetical protein